MGVRVPRFRPRTTLRCLYRCLSGDHGIYSETRDGILVYHANVQHSNVVFNCVDLAVVESRPFIELPFGITPLAVDSDGIFAQVLSDQITVGILI